MPTKLRIETSNFGATGKIAWGNEGFEIPVTNLYLELDANKIPTVHITALLSDLDAMLGAVKLKELEGINLALICPQCKGGMVRTQYQNEEGDWFVCWLCDCEPDPDIEERAQKMREGL